ncbi:protein kinase C-binding protein NELL1-like [Oscarella lobularis]|uniref:protein kinase C-binding protein NELL1-like n=1 Tax=Oscarella lobularis TaxID=121494 RepID=UPI0033130C54
MVIGRASWFAVLCLVYIGVLQSAIGHGDGSDRSLHLHRYDSTEFAAGSEQSRQILNRLGSSRNFTLEATINFAPKTKKVLVSIKSGKGAMHLWGFEVRPRKNQVVVRYYCAGEPKTLVTYYSLEPDVDHHVTITFANETALFYVNCSRIYSFCIQCLVDRKLPANRWVTAGTVVSPPKSATASNMRLYTDSFPADDPSCFRKMMDSDYSRQQMALMTKMKKKMEALKQDLLNSEMQVRNLSNVVRVKVDELSAWDGCECLKHCHDAEGELRLNGTSWRDEDENCTCSNGRVECECKIDSCPRHYSLLPVAGQKCPKCFKDCRRGNHYIAFNSSEIITDGGVQRNCTCSKESNQQREIINCIKVEQIKSQESFACVLCHVNAACNGTMCKCKEGFEGNGFNCTDIDECQTPCSGDHEVCINTIGSFRCDCKPNYIKVPIAGCVHSSAFG